MNDRDLLMLKGAREQYEKERLASNDPNWTTPWDELPKEVQTDEVHMWMGG